MMPRLRRLKLCLIFTVLTVGVLFSVNIFTFNKLLKPYADQEKYAVKADKWIIIDVTNTSRDTQYVDVPGWRILVFGDSKMDIIRCSNCIHYNKLSSAKVGKLGPSYSDIERIKIGGISHVISAGAEWIFWSNSISDIQDEVNQFKMAALQTGLIYSGRGIMNPACHFSRFGRQTKEQTNLYKLCSWSVASIQKVWRPQTSEKLSNEMVDYFSPPVLVPRHIYHTESLIGSLFHRNLSWSLAPLLNAPQNRIFIWSFWIQRLLWEFNGTTEFLTPLRNMHSENIANTVDVEDQEHVLNELCKKLSGWGCNVKNTFYTCVVDLANAMQQWKYFTLKEVGLIKDWVSLLETNQPNRNVETKNVSSVIETSGLRVAYNPGGNIFAGTNKNETKDKRVLIENPFYSDCETANQTGQPKVLEMTSKPPVIDDILLVIIFNTPGYLYNIKFLNYMYGRHFSHILICGDFLDEFIKYELTKNKVTFIEMKLRLGYFGYQCMMEAMKVGYDVQGYLQISDDVLLNVWNVQDLPPSRPWFQETIRLGNISDVRVISYERKPNPNNPIYWSGWKIPEGRQSLLQLWKHFSVVLKDPNVDRRVERFFKVLEMNAGNNNSAFYEGSDLFYIPASLKESYIIMSSLFLKHTIHLEIGVPTLINGLVSKKEIVRMSGSYLWAWERKLYNQYFNSSHIFLHAFKLSYTFKEKDGKKFMCKIYLPNIDNHLKQLGLT